MDAEGDFLIEPEAILDTRTVRRGNTVARECFIKWCGSSNDDATWEDAQKLQQNTWNLVDKVHFQGEGNDETLQGTECKQMPRRSKRTFRPNPKYMDSYCVPTL